MCVCVCVCGVCVCECVLCVVCGCVCVCVAAYLFFLAFPSPVLFLVPLRKECVSVRKMTRKLKFMFFGPSRKMRETDS